MKLKKTDIVIITILIIVVIAGIIGVAIAVNLMKENSNKENENNGNSINTIEENTINETNTSEDNTIVDPNATPSQQLQELVNSIPGVLTNKANEAIIKSIKIRYAYGYDVSLADQMKFIEVLEIDCKDENLSSLANLIESNQLDKNEKAMDENSASYYNTQIVINGNKKINFSDKNALYNHDDKNMAVVLSDELLKKVGEIVNAEAQKKVSAINAEEVKSAVITNNKGSVTTVDANELRTICTLASFVKLNGTVVDLSNEKITYTVELSNGIKIKVTSGGATGYIVDKNGEQQVKFMFNVEAGLESIFAKYI